MKIELPRFALICLLGLLFFPAARAQRAGVWLPSPADRVSEQDIADAYLYLLGRMLVLRQERFDFEQGGFQWNKLMHRDPGGEINPNFDVACSEGWVAVDEQTCVLLEIPAVKGRYYTWHVLNGWGETVLNINERTFPRSASGRFALCLAESHPKIPEGALRVDLPSKTARVFARVELGANGRDALRLQRKFKLTAQGEVDPEPLISVPLFSNHNLPGAEAFDFAAEILSGEPDINPGMEVVRAKVRYVETLARADDDGRSRVSRAIQKLAVPGLMIRLEQWDVRNGWLRGAPAGNYGNDYVMRTLMNLMNLWANNPTETAHFANQALDGGANYTLTFPAEALPRDKVRYFWSISALDAVEYRVMPNAPQRYLLGSQSALRSNPDGSLTLAFGPEQPLGVAEPNWLPTVAGEKYNLTLRFYGPSSDIYYGQYFPPPLVEQK